MELSSLLGPDGIDGLEVLSGHGGLAFCRLWPDSAEDGRNGVLVALPVSEQPSPLALRRLAHEYALRNELDGSWAVLPRELVQERGRIILVLDDPGGELLSRLPML